MKSWRGGFWLLACPKGPMAIGVASSAGPGVPAWVFLRRENHDSPPAFDRAVVETTDCYRHYEKTKRLRMAAQERMEARRSYWFKRRITADRYLDAVEQYASLLSDEHRHLAAYNSAITAVSACQGTLLANENIIVQAPGQHETFPSFSMEEIVP